MRPILIIFLATFSFLASGQMYFPSDTEWESIEPVSVGMASERIDSLYAFLDSTNTKAFILLENGKIVLEQYFDDFTQDDPWYWASAGKSLAASLVGILQSQDYLNINEPTSTYLGDGWTSLNPAEESEILIRHQISMSTGLNDLIEPTADNPDPLNCLDPDCLQFLSTPDTRWAYHNAPYRLVQDVMAAAYDAPINQVTRNELWNKIGGNGAWINYVHWSKPRNMARFGLFMLAGGSWDGDTLITDRTYFNNMINPSQDINKSYGYLWWLNGQDSYMIPRLQTPLNGSLIPNAPDDVYCGLGKNDQKLYIVPSRNQVIIRMGDDAGDSGFAITGYDNELWGYINNLYEITSTEDIIEQVPVDITWNNKTHFKLTIPQAAYLTVSTITGQVLYRKLLQSGKNTISFSNPNEEIIVTTVKIGDRVVWSEVWD